MKLEDFTAATEKITEIDNGQLHTLEEDLITAFDEADKADDVGTLTKLHDILKTVRADISRRADEVIERASKDKPAAAETPEPTPPAETPPAETTPVAETPPAAAPTEETPASAPVVETPAAAPAPEPTPVIVEQEGIPVAASSNTVAVPRGAEPIVAAAPNSRVFAGADIPGYTAGHEFTSSDEFGKALASRINTLSRLSGGDGEQVVIASIQIPTPDDRVLTDDAAKNADKIEAITNPDAIVASGGCCAPLVTRYELFDCGGVTDRPVRDALAGFRADRGGIRYYKGPALADLQGALGFWTCADDAAADVNTPSTWKVCARINCPPEQTAELQALTMCLTFGVLQTRIFPEVAVANNKLALVAQARLADAALLAQIKAGSTAITDAGTPLGAVRDLLDTLGRAAIYFRDRYRIKGVPLRAIIPSWIVEVLRGDLIKGPQEDDARGFFGISDDEIQGFFADRNINVTWALDSAVPATLGGGFFAAATTTLPAWPTSVQWALYPEGTWLHLDGGSLDLGIIRDSTLARTNDYMTFSETFESVANIGCESLWITSAIDVSGKAQGWIAG